MSLEIGYWEPHYWDAGFWESHYWPHYGPPVEGGMVGRRRRVRHTSQQLQIPVEVVVHKEVSVQFTLTLDLKRRISETGAFSFTVQQFLQFDVPLMLDLRMPVSSSGSFGFIDVDGQILKRLRALSLLVGLELVEKIDE